MDDTPEHVKKIHLKIWFAKSPGERLRQFLAGSDAFFKAIEEAKKKLAEKRNQQLSPENLNTKE